MLNENDHWLVEVWVDTNFLEGKLVKCITMLTHMDIQKFYFWEIFEDNIHERYDRIFIQRISILGTINIKMVNKIWAQIKEVGELIKIDLK